MPKTSSLFPILYSGLYLRDYSLSLLACGGGGAVIAFESGEKTKREACRSHCRSAFRKRTKRPPAYNGANSLPRLEKPSALVVVIGYPHLLV